MGTRKVELGKTGRIVVAQIRLRRERQHLSLQALSDRVGAIGRPILASGLSKIEAGTRRVDVDDLVALAAALVTTPSELLEEPAPRPTATDKALAQQVAALERRVAELETSPA